MQPDDLLDRAAVCRYFGGNSPINAATLYRGIRKGRYPKPVHVGPGDLLPNLSSFIRRVCSGYAPDRGVLRTQSV